MLGWGKKNENREDFLHLVRDAPYTVGCIAERPLISFSNLNFLLSIIIAQLSTKQKEKTKSQLSAKTTIIMETKSTFEQAKYPLHNHNPKVGKGQNPTDAAPPNKALPYLPLGTKEESIKLINWLLILIIINSSRKRKVKKKNVCVIWLCLVGAYHI